MTDGDQVGDALAAIVADAIGFARAEERILAVLEGDLVSAVDRIMALVLREPFLEPELSVAVAAIAEAGQSLQRAHMALRARFETRWNTTIQPNEGDQDE